MMGTHWKKAVEDDLKEVRLCTVYVISRETVRSNQWISVFPDSGENRGAGSATCV